MAHALDNMMVFTGNANPALAAGVAKQLGIRLGTGIVSAIINSAIGGIIVLVILSLIRRA